MELLPIANAFKAARLFNPERITESKPTAQTIDELKVFFFFGGCCFELKAELAEYISIAEGVTNVNILEWAGEE